MAEYKILLFNPGSTSMKVGFYVGGKAAFSENFDITGGGDRKFENIREQYEYCKQLVVDAVNESGYKMSDLDMILARAGGMAPCESGIYSVNDKLMEMNSVDLPSTTTRQIGSDFVLDMNKEYGCKGYVINDSAVDEFINEARVTGLKGVWRSTYSHALNQKKAGQLAAEARGAKYEDLNLIIAHLGGGVSIGAHRKGKLIDTTNLVGEGPMSPTRTGGLELSVVCMGIMKKEIDVRQLMGVALNKGGGLMGQLGTADGIEVEKMIKDGNKFAKLIYDGMIYQFAQSIAKMAATLEGKVDAIVLTGGLSFSNYIVDALRQKCGWIADIEVFAGEFETEAMIDQATAVLDGRASVKEYTGIPAFNPKKFEQ